MKKKFILGMALTTALCLSASIVSFAGWEQTGTTWKYNSNGTYFNNGWNWIDGNGDGIAECYYFNADGLMLANTTTPDNYTVNEQGAWTVNGIVQTQSVVKETQSTVKETQPQATEAYVDPQPEQNTTIPDTSTYTSPGEIIFDDTPLSSDQHLSPEQEKAINEIEFN